MDISTALPLGIGAASIALGGAKSAAEGIFQFFSEDEQTTQPQSEAETGLDSLLASSGFLNSLTAEPGKLENDLRELDDFLRDEFFRAGISLPESYTLKIGLDGQLESLADDEVLTQQANQLLANSQVGARIQDSIRSKIQELAAIQQFAAPTDSEGSSSSDSSSLKAIVQGRDSIAYELVSD